MYICADALIWIESTVEDAHVPDDKPRKVFKVLKEA